VSRQISPPSQPKNDWKNLISSNIWLHLSYSVLTTLLCLGLTARAKAVIRPNVELKVGILQRFGDEPTDKLNLQATPGDRLILKFKTGERQQTLQASSAKLEVVMQTLPLPVVEERVVLSTHRSFETAENSAEQWRKKGIEAEIAQPERWQVWAKRKVYNTPLLRRLLLRSLQAKGNKTAYVDTQILQQIPQTSLVVNGYRYNRNELDITTSKNLIRLSEGNKRDVLYAGGLHLQPNAYGTYTLVNNVPLETYLRGVVPHEIGANAPYAAVEAQAIIARTYALRNLRRFTLDGYELCADTHCQVYRGLSGTVQNADQAIAATRGQVLTYQNELVDALYSSTTGGITATFSDIWNGADRAYLQPVVDAAGNVWNLDRQTLADEKNFQRFISLRQGFNETGWGMFRWRKASSMEQISKDLQHYLEVNKNPIAFKKIQQLQVVERSPSGRILKLAVQTDRGIFVLEKDEVRNAFSAPRSTLFYLEPLNKGKMLWGYSFVGGGLGHGVGLSQTGSQRLAQLGWSSSRILNFYYPTTQIKPLSDQITFWSQPLTTSQK
jgi:SpoIID/LytB domain protein